jgi:predicted RNase H-like HicB family nuclease
MELQLDFYSESIKSSLKRFLFSFWIKGVMVMKEFDVIIEKDKGGWLIADVPAIKGCHTQGKNMNELLKNVKEAIELCLEVQKEDKINEKPSFVGIKQVKINA